MVRIILLLFFGICFSCKNNEDCQLNGNCSNGVCDCDAAWTGPTCSTLHLKPAPVMGALQRSDISSWGGSVIRIGNTYHMYAAEMANHCGLNTWEKNSIIVHAVSNTPAGPYNKVDQVMTYFSHNPTAVLSTKDNTIVLYHIGGGGGGNPEKCTNGSTPSTYIKETKTSPTAAPGNFEILFSSSPNGPWEVFNGSGSKCDGTTTVTGYNCDSTDNPAPISNEDGSVLVLKRSWNSNAQLTTLIGIAKADSWKGPYLHSHNPVFLDENEDPFLYKNSRGYHALFHGMKPYDQSIYAGRHAFSVDGWNWTFSDTPAYNSTVVNVDGTVTTYARRERPHLLIEDGKLTHLFTGVQKVWYNDYTFTHVQPINT